MRVLITGFVNDIHVVRWCNALAERGLDIHLATVHEPSGMNPLDDRVTLHVLSKHGSTGYLTAIPALRRLAMQLQPDLIHAHYAGGYGTMTRLAGVRPFLLSVYGDDVFETPNISWVHRKIITDNLRKADHIASTSHIMKEQTLQLFPGADVTVTPFGVDTSQFCPPAATTPDHSPLLNSERPITIGTVKKLTDKYGIDTLLHAFAQLVRTMPERTFKLEITGDGPLRTDLFSLAEKLGITNDVTFFPALPHNQVPQQLHRLDIFVAVSRLNGESFGVSIVEAMACGIPVVVSDVGGLPEVTGHGQYASVIPPDQPGILSRAIQDLLVNPHQTLQRATQARAHVINTYSWSACVDSVLELYKRLLS